MYVCVCVLTVMFINCCFINTFTFSVDHHVYSLSVNKWLIQSPLSTSHCSLYRWIPVAHMLTPRMNLGVGAIRDMRDAVTGVSFNAIYAIGGYSGKSILGTAEKYDIQLNTWTDIAPMKTPRRNVGE